MAVASVENRIKAWISPSLITCFGIMSWNLISEIRSDVKQLLAANAQVQVEIPNLKARVEGLESVVYSQRMYAIKPEEIDVPKRTKNKSN